MTSSYDVQVEAEVAGLEEMGLQELRIVWRERFGVVPKLRSPQLIRLSLAWRIQVAALGGLDAQTKRRLRRSGAGATAADRLQPGVRLSREWKGVRHEVTVLDGGFSYRDRSFKTLSEIAREVTGTRWNGPRFFGLRPESLAKAA